MATPEEFRALFGDRVDAYEGRRIAEQNAREAVARARRQEIERIRERLAPVVEQTKEMGISAARLLLENDIRPNINVPGIPAHTTTEKKLAGYKWGFPKYKYVPVHHPEVEAVKAWEVMRWVSGSRTVTIDNPWPSDPDKWSNGPTTDIEPIWSQAYLLGNRGLVVSNDNYGVTNAADYNVGNSYGFSVLEVWSQDGKNKLPNPDAPESELKVQNEIIALLKTHHII